MGVDIDITYNGQLRCTAIHGPSGATLITDAPTDNCGKGEEFAPTDLVGTALGSCILTIMGIVAQRHKLDIEGTTAHITKEMVQGASRRIRKLNIEITIPYEKSVHLSEKDRLRLEAATHHCPVELSLHPDIETVVTLIFLEP